MKELMELMAPCHFGLEAVLKREIQDLGYEISCVEDGRVTFYGDAQAIAVANVFLRTAERILLKVGSVHAVTYDELFEGVRAMPWERYLPIDAKFWVTKATTVKSRLFSPSDIQSIVKKAVVERLKGVYRVNWFAEDGAAYPIRVFFMKDEAVLTLDTTGESLHKRGYRKLTAKAPISETLAAALIMLTPWKADRILVDPFCGSGTFPIEAAMMAANIAPGMERSFLAENWDNLILRRNWYDAVEEAQDLVDSSVKNQGSYGTCWAITATYALETALLPEERIVFSADHLTRRNSFTASVNDGGDYLMLMAYLCGWQGPVTEEEDPYGDEYSPDDLEPVVHVQEVRVLLDSSIEKIKETVYTYGSVQTSLFMDRTTASADSGYYNEATSSYYYTEEITQNHDVLILGWDDAWPAEAFAAAPGQDGAYPE